MISDNMEKEITITKKHLDVFKENTASIENKIVIHQGWTNDVPAAWPKDLIIDLLFIDAGRIAITFTLSKDWHGTSLNRSKDQC